MMIGADSDQELIRDLSDRIVDLEQENALLRAEVSEAVRRAVVAEAECIRLRAECERLSKIEDAHVSCVDWPRERTLRAEAEVEGWYLTAKETNERLATAETEVKRLEGLIAGLPTLPIYERQLPDLWAEAERIRGGR